jgi:hypothetical protein
MGANVRRAALRSSLAAALAAALATTAGVTAACSGEAAPANLISVSNGGCGGSWQLAAPGWYTFQVHNAAAENAEVDLVDPANGAVYAGSSRAPRASPPGPPAAATSWCG